MFYTNGNYLSLPTQKGVMNYLSLATKKRNHKLLIFANQKKKIINYLSLQPKKNLLTTYGIGVVVADADAAIINSENDGSLPCI